MNQQKLSLTQRLMVDRIASVLSKEGIGNLNYAALVRLLRKRFHMTQKQLAERCGLPQSFISKLEAGTHEPSFKTLRKVFRVFSCDLFIVPIAESSFDEILEKQARKYVEKNLEYVKGTMSLEMQHPDKEFIQALIEEEVKTLLCSGTSKIWDVS